MQSIHTRCAILGNIAEVNSLREQWRIVIDVLQIDLYVSVTDQTFTALILCKYRESPLRSTVGLVPVQRLEDTDIALSFTALFEAPC